MKSSICLATTLLIGLAGCYSFKPNAMLDGKSPELTPHATIVDADGVRCVKINGKALRQHFRITPGKGDSSERYLVPAGACELVVEYSNNTGTTFFSGVAKTLKFNAIAGKTYKLNSFVSAMFHGGTLRSDQWDARLHDEAVSDRKSFVVQTTDTKKN